MDDRFRPYMKTQAEMDAMREAFLAFDRATRTQTMLEPLRPVQFSDFDVWALKEWRMKP